MSNDINADLARALGLSLDRLRAFTLRVEAQKPAVVVAEYYPKDISASDFEMVLTRHELRPIDPKPTLVSLNDDCSITLSDGRTLYGSDGFTWSPTEPLGTPPPPPEPPRRD
jgi:hypothetical protein